MKALLVLLLTTAGSLLASYHPPREGALLFRRDSLSIDTNRQILLAKDLIQLAVRPTALDNPSQRRATAQLLALAANLNPSSSTHTDLNQILAGDDPGDVFSDTPKKDTIQSLTPTVRYLLEDKNNKKNLLVAQLILDPLAIVAPNASADLVSLKPNAKESALWHNVIAPLERFQKIVQPKEKPAPTEQPKTPEKKEKAPAIELAKFEGNIRLPLILANDEAPEKTLQGIQTLNLRAELKKQKAQIKAPMANSKVNTAIQDFLSTRHSKQAIQQTSANFSLPKGEYHTKNGDLIALPIALLLEGFLSERQPIDNLIVFGKLNPDGSITAPDNPWTCLNTLVKTSPENTSRLLVPPNLRLHCEALLTMQNEDFFMDFDVFEVATFDDACELGFIDAAQDQATEALEKFAEIRKIAELKTTSVFVSNSFVIKRLKETHEAESRYLSPRMLELRGTNKQPAHHPTEILASLIHDALAPSKAMAYNQNPHNVEAISLEEIHEKSREKLDSLARQVSFRDRELYEQATSLSNLYRTLARAKNRYNKEDSKSLEILAVRKYFDAFKSMQSDHYALATQLASILEQTPPTDPLAEEK